MPEMFDKTDLETKAHSKFNAGEFLAAAREFERASKAYALAGDEIHAAEMLSNSSVSYLKAGEPKLALSILEDCNETFRQFGDHRKLAIEIGNRAAALDVLGKFDEALKQYQSSADFFNRVGDDDLYMSTIQAISTMQLKKGRYSDALETMQVGFSRVKKPTRKQSFLSRLFDIPLKILGR